MEEKHININMVKMPTFSLHKRTTSSSPKLGVALTMISLLCDRFNLLEYPLSEAIEY